MHLLENLAKLDILDEDNNTPLSLALLNEHLNFVILLLHHNDNVNTQIFCKKKLKPVKNPFI